MSTRCGEVHASENPYAIHSGRLAAVFYIISYAYGGPVFAGSLQIWAQIQIYYRKNLGKIYLPHHQIVFTIAPNFVIILQ